LQILSLLVHDDWGVMQRIAGVLTRKRITLDTILAGNCERPGCVRVILASGHPQFGRMIEHLRRVHDVIEIEYFEDNADALALVRSPSGAKPVVGKAADVDEALARENGAAYVKAYGAL
jgi:acetolactate synthase-1/3 small subunit